MRIVRVVLPFALSALLAGCGIKPRPATPNLDAGTVITDAQIAETGARTMWEALQRTVKYTRFQESGTGTPERIHRRGSSTIVLSDDMPIFIDHVRVLEIKVLSSMPARDIEHIQVLNGVYATTYYGTNSGDGVILIRTREAERSRKEEGAPRSLRDAPRHSSERECSARHASRFRHNDWGSTLGFSDSSKGTGKLTSAP